MSDRMHTRRTRRQPNSRGRRCHALNLAALGKARRGRRWRTERGAKERQEEIEVDYEPVPDVLSTSYWVDRGNESPQIGTVPCTNLVS